MATVDTAVVAVTARGLTTARRLSAVHPDWIVYTPAGNTTEVRAGEVAYTGKTAEVIGELFRNRRQLVLLMATGIAVRALAPHLTAKDSDPAVVVMDEAGRNVISLISGHLGGANELAHAVAAELGTVPVITTASDNAGYPAPDNLAQKQGWRTAPGSDLTRLAAAMVNGEPTGVFQDAGDTTWQSTLPEHARVYGSLEELKAARPSAGWIITARDIVPDCNSITAVFHPPTLFIGIGCNRGTGAAEIARAVGGVLAKNGLSMAAVAGLGSAEVKRDEAGLTEYAADQGLGIRFFPAEELAAVDVPSAPSAYAAEHAGTPSVAEAAAILGSGYGRLILPKQAVERKITVAIGEIKPQPSTGRLYVIGLGPGDSGNMSFRARRALKEAEAVVGYKMYLDLIAPYIVGKRIVSSGMTREVERTRQAVHMAGEGRTVALVSSGDAGIYGMAGLALEVAAETEKKPDIVVVPGISAVGAAAALLGAPLMSDFCTISLSDYLTEWPDIEKRLLAAAETDFVIALYNPKSRKRPHQLARAVELVSLHRPGNTPAGIVSDACRPEQKVVTTTLAALPGEDIGMTSIVIIGNSKTILTNGRMITSRGYQRKYRLAEPED